MFCTYLRESKQKELAELASEWAQRHPFEKVTESAFEKM
jgi:hypothetical protein